MKVQHRNSKTGFALLETSLLLAILLPLLIVGTYVALTYRKVSRLNELLSEFALSINTRAMSLGTGNQLVWPYENSNRVSTDRPELGVDTDDEGTPIGFAAAVAKLEANVKNLISCQGVNCESDYYGIYFSKGMLSINKLTGHVVCSEFASRAGGGTCDKHEETDPSDTENHHEEFDEEWRGHLATEDKEKNFRDAIVSFVNSANAQPQQFFLSLPGALNGTISLQRYAYPDLGFSDGNQRSEAVEYIRRQLLVAVAVELKLQDGSFNSFVLPVLSSVNSSSFQRGNIYAERVFALRNPL